MKSRSLVVQFLMAAFLAMIAAAPATVVLACGQGMPDPVDAGAVARETARGAVTVAADAVGKSDVACAAIAMAAKDKPLAQKCAAVYDVARTSLISAAIAVDTWDDASSRSQVTCAVVDVVRGLADIGRELKTRGVDPRVLAALDDAQALAKLLGACSAPASSTAKEGGH